MRRFDRLSWALLVIGLGLLLYHPVAAAVNDLRTQHRLATVEAQLRANAARMQADQAAVNARLAANGLIPNAPSFDRTDVAADTAAHLLGTLTIPKLGLILPVFDSTAPGLLAQGAGVVPGTSYPLGGPSTHSVLAAHNGLPGQTLFMHLDRLRIGDRFAVTVGGVTRTYAVERRRTVLPDAVNALTLAPGRDLVTLLTCTPWMQNTHRLLVTGHRVPTTPTDRAQVKATLARHRQWDWLLLGLLVALPPLTLGLRTWRRHFSSRA